MGHLVVRRVDCGCFDRKDLGIFCGMREFLHFGSYALFRGNDTFMKELRPTRESSMVYAFRCSVFELGVEVC